MKTAMQELIEWCNQYEGQMISADQVVLKANELLYQEKYEIINAVNAGDSTSFWEAYNNAEDYYNQAYKQ
jgi:hypothetical protein